MRPNAATLQVLSKYRDLLPIGIGIGRNIKQHSHTAMTEIPKEGKELKETKESKEDSSDNIPHEKKKYRTEGINIEFHPDRKVIAMYVRRGAKGVEMTLKPFKDYADAALILSKNGLMNMTTSINSNRSRSTDISSSAYVNMKSEESESFNFDNDNGHDGTLHKQDIATILEQPSSSSSSSSPPPPPPPPQSLPSSHALNRIHEIALRPIIFLGTEDPEVIDEALEWGRKNHWQVTDMILYDMI